MSSNLERMRPQTDLAHFLQMFCPGVEAEPCAIPTDPYGLPEEDTPPGEGVIYRGSCRNVDIVSDTCCDGYNVGKILPPGFVEVEEFGKQPYRYVWTNDALRAICTYCEGDVSVTVDNTELVYRGRLASARAFYCNH